MGTVVVDMSEVEEVVVHLLASGGTGANVGHEAVKTVGAQVDARAEGAAPQERPWLAVQGIRHKTWRDATGSHTDIFTVPDDQGRPVGMFREYGTSVLPPQPFLTIQAPWAEMALHAAILAKIEVFDGG